MKKIICASLFIGGLLGAEVASADPRVSGAVTFGDRNVAGTVYYNQPPMYYGYPAPVYYTRPVMAPYYGVYYGPHYRHHHNHHGWKHHHNHHRHHGHHGHHGHHHGGHHRH